MLDMSKKELTFSVALGFLIFAACAFFTNMSILVIKATNPYQYEYKLYHVVFKDEDDYYIAVEAVEEDGYTFVPDEYYEDMSKMVVYTEENVKGKLPHQGDYAWIAMDSNDEHPIVRLYEGDE